MTGRLPGRQAGQGQCAGRVPTVRARTEPGWRRASFGLACPIGPIFEGQISTGVGHERESGVGLGRCGGHPRRGIAPLSEALTK
jgi:hypothetical protein